MQIPASISIKEFSEKVGVWRIIQFFWKMALWWPTQTLDFDTFAIIAPKLMFKIRHCRRDRKRRGVERKSWRSFNDRWEEKILFRPVLWWWDTLIMGKTKILRFHSSNESSGRKAGGITQHIGAYQIEKGKHAVSRYSWSWAFTAVRARGAKTADIAILVVVCWWRSETSRPLKRLIRARSRTSHYCWVNKIDKADANIDRVKGELATHGLTSEDWEEIQFLFRFQHCRTKNRRSPRYDYSSVWVLELKANPKRLWWGPLSITSWSFAHPIMTILSQYRNSFRGNHWGGVYWSAKTMVNDEGKKVQFPPGMPVQYSILSEVLLEILPVLPLWAVREKKEEFSRPRRRKAAGAGLRKSWQGFNKGP